MNITVKVEGQEKVIASVKQYTATVMKRVQATIMIAAFNVQERAKRLAPVDVGNLRSSIKANMLSGGLGAEIGVGRQLNVKYGPYMEYGTKPHWPPPGVLTEWCRRHGIEGKEFLIRRKIARRGTKPRPFLMPAWEEVRPGFIKAIKDLSNH